MNRLKRLNIQLTCFSLSSRSRCSNGRPAPIGLGVFSCSWLTGGGGSGCVACTGGSLVDVSWISSDRTRGIRLKTPFVILCCSGCSSIDSLLLRPVALFNSTNDTKCNNKSSVKPNWKLLPTAQPQCACLPHHSSHTARIHLPSRFLQHILNPLDIAP